MVLDTVGSYAKRGYRILSFAYQEYDQLPSNLPENRDQIESNLIYLGFVAIMDPPRENVKHAVKTCHDAGVDVVLLTTPPQPATIGLAPDVPPKLSA